MRDYANVAPIFWTDHRGQIWKTPTVRGRLKFRIPCHRALRAFVFYRDGFRCVRCGVKAPNIPDNYDGLNTIPVSEDRWLVMDHTLSRRNGGSHHPLNLQTFCDVCNASKAATEDIGRNPLLLGVADA